MAFKTKDDFIRRMLEREVADTKYIESQHAYFEGDKRACPVTVSEAVDFCLRHEIYPGIRQDEDFLSGNLRTQLVLGYFSAEDIEPLIWYNAGTIEPNFESEEKASRLEGELRRFGSDIFFGDPRGIRITHYLADKYCERSDMPVLRAMIKERLNV